MVDDPITALSRLMDRFAREHWDDRFSSDRARLSVDGDALTCSAVPKRSAVTQAHPCCS